MLRAHGKSARQMAGFGPFGLIVRLVVCYSRTLLAKAYSQVWRQ